MLLIIFAIVWFLLGAVVATIAAIDCYKTQTTFSLVDLLMCLVLLLGGICSAAMALLEYTDTTIVILKKKR